MKTRLSHNSDILDTTREQFLLFREVLWQKFIEWILPRFPTLLLDQLLDVNNSQSLDYVAERVMNPTKYL